MSVEVEEGFASKVCDSAVFCASTYLPTPTNRPADRACRFFFSSFRQICSVYAKKSAPRYLAARAYAYAGGCLLDSIGGVERHLSSMRNSGGQGRPILPLLAVDFNGDTLTDVLLVTRNGLYGYGQVRHPTGVPFAALLASLIVAMAVVYFTHQTGSKSGPKSGRATDRVD